MLLKNVYKLSIVFMFFCSLDLCAKAEQNKIFTVNDFIESIGVNTHLSNRRTNYYQQFDNLLKPRLIELGVYHIRDGVWKSDISSDSLVRKRFIDLSKFGIKSNIIVDPRMGLSPIDTLEIIKNYSRSLEIIEGPNELDINQDDSRTHYKGLNFPLNIIEFQSDLKKQINGRVPLLAPSIVRATNSKLIGEIQCNYGNIHTYVSNTFPGHMFLETQDMFIGRNQCPGKQIIATEAGWHTAIDATDPGIPEDIQAKYVPRIFAEHFHRGIKRTYIYEFMDEGLNSIEKEHNFGLIRYDGSPKPAFIALKNLINILKGSASYFPLKYLAFNVAGDTQNVKYLSLQKNVNKFFLIIWQEVQGYDRFKKTYIDYPLKTVKIHFKDPTRVISTYYPTDSALGFQDPGKKNENSIYQWINPNTLSLKVSDQLLVVQLTLK